MQPQTMNAVAIAQKIPKYSCCIVMFSLAQHHARQTFRWRKEPCDGQQRNEDQNAHRKVIDHVRKTRGHLLTSKPVGEDQMQRPLSVPCQWRGPRQELRGSWKCPFLVMCKLPEQGKELRHRHHVL